MKAKSRVTGWKSESSSFGLIFVGFAFGARERVESDLEGDDRPFGVERLAARADAVRRNAPTTSFGPNCSVAERPG